MWIVRFALQRPYTFVIVAALIAIFGTSAILNTPTDIPIVSVIWTYSGIDADDMSNLNESQMSSRGSVRLDYTEMNGSCFTFDTLRAHEDWCRWRAQHHAGEWCHRIKGSSQRHFDV